MSIIINAFIFLILAAVIPGITINSIWSALGAAIVYGILSFLVEPILKFITIPLNWLTFGIVHFLLSGLILYMTSGLVGGFSISSFWVALFASAILGLLQSAFASRRDL
ncbi:phage holin family protein [Fundicoccus culcitae]|uniref:Phage holin family protein n=1 Tax=Fundicoccus culcitae TaxID=2969821 RepID=A0ABY5P3A4_9LACT|nr:phage holin family protein [Fundicoccus culcitae]UUX32923.1 phage holin family protein [Fundicoccus culcitae]